MAAVMIGVDPHKGSHTAAIIGAAVEPLGELRVRVSAVQVQRLLAWAAAWPEWTWAVEGAGGLDHLLAQQLLAAGEQAAQQPLLGCCKSPRRKTALRTLPPAERGSAMQTKRGTEVGAWRVAAITAALAGVACLAAACSNPARPAAGRSL